LCLTQDACLLAAGYKEIRTILEGQIINQVTFLDKSLLRRVGFDARPRSQAPWIKPIGCVDRNTER
jgi:hypothetical protein